MRATPHNVTMIYQNKLINLTLTSFSRSQRSNQRSNRSIYYISAVQTDIACLICTKISMSMLHGTRNIPMKDFLFFSNSNMAARGQRSKIDQIRPPKYNSASQMNPIHKNAQGTIFSENLMCFEQNSTKIGHLFQKLTTGGRFENSIFTEK